MTSKRRLEPKSVVDEKMFSVIMRPRTSMMQSNRATPFDNRCKMVIQAEITFESSIQEGVVVSPVPESVTESTLGKDIDEKIQEKSFEKPQELDEKPNTELVVLNASHEGDNDSDNVQPNKKTKLNDNDETSTLRAEEIKRIETRTKLDTLVGILKASARLRRKREEDEDDF